jgi:GAF domain-containing protein/anti-sigma regulatory factor (Ser/Thr protein kinase)
MPIDSDTRQMSELCRGEAMLMAVYQAAERVTAETDLTRALEAILACVHDPLGLDRAGVFLYRRQRGDLVRVIGVGLDGAIEHGPEARILISDRRGPMQRVALGLIPYFHSHDVRQDVDPQVQMPAGLAAHVIVPLVNRGEILGVMAVDNMLTGRDISEAMVQPLCLFAHFAAMALGNALRADDLVDLNHKLQRLATLSSRLAGILQPDALLEQMLGELPALLRADRASAWRRRSERSWECVAAFGLSPDYLTAATGLYNRRGRGRSLGERAFHQMDPVFVADVPSRVTRSRFASVLQQEGFRSLLAIPLCHGVEILGCVNLYYDDTPELTEQDWEIARLFARHAGTLMRNAELFEARAALADELGHVNSQLETDRQLLLERQEALQHSEMQKKQFYRDVLYCITNGKLVLSDREELLRDWESQTQILVIEAADDVKTCRDYVYEQARAAGIEAEERLNDLCLCTSEATTNALKHAGGGWMSVGQRDDFLRVWVCDHGNGIDTLRLPHSTLLRGFSTHRSMGLGFTLMHEMSDRLCLATDDRGTLLILELAIHPESQLEQAFSMLNSVDF